MKASQLGISWLVAILALQNALFNETSKVLMLSQGQTEARDLLSKVSFINDNLPEHLKLVPARDNRENIFFKDNHAEIQALPSTEKAGHGFQGSLVIRDELARHENARENYRAVARAISSGGKLIELSTANKTDPENFFQEKTLDFYRHFLTRKKVLKSGIELYTNRSKPGMCMVFLSWKLRPVRTEGMTLEEWYQSRIIPRYTELEREEQFPQTIDEVFSASVSKGYFDNKILDEMMQDWCPPIRQTEIDTFNEVVRVYKPPVIGRKYVLFTDPSDGVEDPFVLGIMDYVTGEVVCTATGKIKIDQVSKIHDYLSRTYNNATNSYEYTGSVGGAMSMCLEQLNTPNQSPRYAPEGKTVLDKRGQYVSLQMKNENLGNLSFCINKRRIIVHDSEFVQQCKQVLRNDKTGEPITERKSSFDWVMMMAGLCLLQKKSISSGGLSIRTYFPSRGDTWQLANTR